MQGGRVQFVGDRAEVCGQRAADEFARGQELEIGGDAVARGILCNVADAPEEGSFHLPAVYRGAHATIAVSTSGVDPAGAKRLRDQIARWMEQ